LFSFSFPPLAFRVALDPVTVLLLYFKINH
jgi:hypothetical protein